MRVFAASPAGCLGLLTNDPKELLSELWDWAQVAPPGAKIVFEVREMDRQHFYTLPDFVGYERIDSFPEIVSPKKEEPSAG